ncbi:uncharacterized protein [Littorina saxatilis]|uniref:uncharacterized protein isoform X2 n=1 Tax=Littorina saxatilis TaxID=31220 RepID=UPI0038B62E0E
MYEGLLFALHLVTGFAAFSYNPKAVIVSPDGTSPLEFAVGSDVTLQCRLTSSAASLYDVTELALKRKSTGEFLDVTVVGNDTVEATLVNVTAMSRDVISCLDKRYNRALVTQDVCVGDAPSDFDVRCELSPYVSFQCCVMTEQPHNRLCDVNWTLEYYQTRLGKGQWRTFSGDGFDDDLCATWALQSSYNRLQLYKKVTVRAASSNQIGSANTSITLVPARYATSGPVQNLTVKTNSSYSRSLVVTWERNDKLTTLLCQDMGLVYNVVLTSLHDSTSRSEKVNGAQSHKHEYTFTGLSPNTRYNATVVPLSHHFSGPARSHEVKTPQSRPLKAPEIVGWSFSTMPTGGVAVYWRKLSHEDKGGPITAYSVSVKAHSLGTKTHSVNVSEVPGSQQRVTTPTVVPGCSAGCVVTVTVSTRVGPSPPATVTIPPPQQRDQPVPVVRTTQEANRSRTVSWEGVVHVTSVVWCFGSRYPNHSSLVKCQTDLQERAVSLTEHQYMNIGENFEVPTEKGELPQYCENCQWHFAIRLFATDTDTAIGTDTASGTGVSRLVWNKPIEIDNGLTSDSYHLAVPVGVALGLTVAFPLCILCLTWCVRRTNRKKGQFSPLKIDGPEEGLKVKPKTAYAGKDVSYQGRCSMTSEDSGVESTGENKSSDRGANSGSKECIDLPTSGLGHNNITEIEMTSRTPRTSISNRAARHCQPCVEQEAGLAEEGVEGKDDASEPLLARQSAHEERGSGTEEERKMTDHRESQCVQPFAWEAGVEFAENHVKAVCIQPNLDTCYVKMVHGNDVETSGKALRCEESKHSSAGINITDPKVTSKAIEKLKDASASVPLGQQSESYLRTVLSPTTGTYTQLDVLTSPTERVSGHQSSPAAIPQVFKGLKQIRHDTALDRPILSPVPEVIECGIKSDEKFSATLVVQTVSSPPIQKDVVRCYAEINADSAEDGDGQTVTGADSPLGQQTLQNVLVIDSNSGVEGVANLESIPPSKERGYNTSKKAQRQQRECNSLCECSGNQSEPEYQCECHSHAERSEIRSESKMQCECLSPSERLGIQPKHKFLCESHSLGEDSGILCTQSSIAALPNVVCHSGYMPESHLFRVPDHRH